MTIKQINLMTSPEVSEAFSVDVKTVTRWANEGKLTCLLTIGGHRRFYDVEIRALLVGKPLSRDARDQLAEAYAAQVAGS